MGFKTRITQQGIITTPTAGADSLSIEVPMQITGSSTTSNVSPYALSPNVISTDNMRIDYGGVYFISRSATLGAPMINVSLAHASNSIGAQVVISNTDIHSHSVTSPSRIVSTNTLTQSLTIRFPKIQGSSVILQSDGTNWLVLGGSGSLAFI